MLGIQYRSRRRLRLGSPDGPALRDPAPAARFDARGIWGAIAAGGDDGSRRASPWADSAVQSKRIGEIFGRRFALARTDRTPPWSPATEPLSPAKSEGSSR